MLELLPQFEQPLRILPEPLLRFFGVDLVPILGVLFHKVWGYPGWVADVVDHFLGCFLYLGNDLKGRRAIADDRNLFPRPVVRLVPDVIVRDNE